MEGKKKQISPVNNSFKEFLLYKTPDGKVKVEFFLRDENIWLTQVKIAELFRTERSVITKHLINIYDEGELNKNATSAKFAQVQTEGRREVKRNIEFYNLDAIIAVGYRVNSKMATQFRIWATQILREYIIKGFAMDDERLKNPTNIFGKDYFDEQLARIRDIRTSERRFYQKITDIYAECSADYDSNDDITKQFYATAQNKLHFAITGQTAAEIINSRVSSSKYNMGLATWKNAPIGKIRKTDAVIAKNYLNEKELDHLNRIVTMYLDYAELQAKAGRIMYMKDWIGKLDAFLKFNERDILHNAEKVSNEVATALAEREFEKFQRVQDQKHVSDFDRKVIKFLNDNKNIDKYKKYTRTEQQANLYSFIPTRNHYLENFCSRSNSHFFLPSPPPYPVRFPSLPITLWHGMIKAILLHPLALATALTALGLFNLIACSL